MTEVDVDAPELRLIASLASISPARLAAALNDPEHIRRHITPDEAQQLMDALGRLIPVVKQINIAIEFARGVRR